VSLASVVTRSARLGKEEIIEIDGQLVLPEVIEQGVSLYMQDASVTALSQRSGTDSSSEDS